MYSSETLSIFSPPAATSKLLGREGEIALAKQIEALEIECWYLLLSNEKMIPLALDIINYRGLDCMAPMGVAEISMMAACIRAHDRDRLCWLEAKAVLPSESAKLRPTDTWLEGVLSCDRRAAAAREHFVNANQRMVIRLSRKYAGLGVSPEDLIQEGNLGLIKAVNRFEYRRGCRFSSKATWWIRGSLSRAVSESSRTVRVPSHVQELNCKIVRAQRRLTTLLGRVPVDDEIAEYCGVPVKKVVATRYHSRRSTTSLDEPIGEGGATRLELLPDPSNDENSIVDRVHEHFVAQCVRRSLEELTPTQADVVTKRFGLQGDAPMTLQGIASQYGLSRERIRQIQQAALRTLRTTLERSECRTKGC